MAARNGFLLPTPAKAQPGEPAVEIKGPVGYLIDIRQVLQQGTAVVLAAVNKDALWQAVEFFPPRSATPLCKRPPQWCRHLGGWK